MMASFHNNLSIKRELLSSSMCPKCGRIGKKCSCYNGLLPAISHALNITGVPTITVSDDHLLDIGNEEASSGSDLDITAPMCEKSDQHNQFIDIDDFDIDCLPDLISHPALVVWLRNCIPLAVRLNNSKSATGRVILFRPTEGKTMICENVNCPHRHLRGPDHIIYGGLAIITNKHVVQSNNDARRTRVEFFYHNMDNRQLVIKETGLELKTTNRAMDYTVFTCSAHTTDLIDVVKLLSDLIKFTWHHIPWTIRRNSQSFAIVLSHPHGSAKKISIGDKKKTKIRDDSGEARENVMLLRSLYNLCERNGGLLRFPEYYKVVKDLPLSYRVTYYTAATCKGSSGAPVYLGNVVTENNMEVNIPHTHRGMDAVEGYNVCFT